MTLFLIQNLDASASVELTRSMSRALLDIRGQVSSAEAAAQWLDTTEVIVDSSVVERGRLINSLWSSTDNKLTSTPSDVTKLPQKARSWLARQEDTSPETLAELASDESVANIWTLELVARNKKTPHRVLEKLSKTTMISVLKAVAGNTSTPPIVLEEMYGDGATTDVILVPGGKLALARNTSTPPWILDKLSASSGTHEWALHVRDQVAMNTSTPPEALRRLSHDVLRVVVNFAQNTSAPPDRLRELALDPMTSSVVLGSVAKNRSTPSDALLALSKHKRQDIRRWAKANPNYKAPSRKRT